jgi:Tfp pilus assembly protein PilF
VKTTRSVGRLLAGLLLLTTACNTMRHTDAKAQAHQRWSQVRGQVKLQLAGQQYDATLFDDAAATLKESIALDPTQTEAYALLAKAYLELGKTASAQQVLDAAGHKSLASAELVYLGGVILEQRGQLEEALAKYASARKLDATNADYLVAQVECLVSLDRAESAMQTLTESANRIDDDGTVSALAAHLATLLDEPGVARRRYGEALAAHGENRLLAEELGRLLIRAQRYEEALAILSPVLDAQDGERTSGTLRRAIATCHLALGNPRMAKQILDPYARSHPEDSIAQLMVAKAALACDDILTALWSVDLAAQHEPNQPELWLVRAAVNWKRGKLITAASDLYDVLQNDPNDVDAHCLLAEVMRARDQADAARMHFEKALQLDPSCPWASAGLRTMNDHSEEPAPAGPTPSLTAAKPMPRLTTEGP